MCSKCDTGIRLCEKVYSVWIAFDKNSTFVLDTASPSWLLLFWTYPLSEGLLTSRLIQRTLANLRLDFTKWSMSHKINWNMCASFSFWGTNISVSSKNKYKLKAVAHIFKLTDWWQVTSKKKLDKTWWWRCPPPRVCWCRAPWGRPRSPSLASPPSSTTSGCASSAALSRLGGRLSRSVSDHRCQITDHRPNMWDHRCVITDLTLWT